MESLVAASESDDGSNESSMFNDALILLSSSTISKSQSQAFRLMKGVPSLLRLLQSISKTSHQMEIMRIIYKCACVEVPFKEALIKEGNTIKVLEAVFTAPNASPDLRLLVIETLWEIINNGTINRQPAIDEMLSRGLIGRLSQLLKADEVNKSSEQLMAAVACVLWEVTDLAPYREKIRDLGCIPVLISLCSKYPDSAGYIGCLTNLSRSQSLHLMLAESGLLESLTLLLSSDVPSMKEVIRIQALITISHVYGGQDSKRGDDGSKAASILSKHNISASMATMMDSVLHGDSLFGGAWWSLEEICHAVASLSRSPKITEAMGKKRNYSLDD